jgi:fatty-acyl-CoA synthase
VITQDANIASWIVEHAASHGDRRAIVDRDRTLTYRALRERVARCAAVLAEAGLARGERVALVMGNRSAYIEVVFAAAQLGAIAVPINARLTAWEIRRMLDDCTPKLLVYDAEHAETALGACEGASPPPAWRRR